MKLREIISESNVLNEKPMGFLKKAALDIAGIVSSKAAEKYNLGNEANQLRKYFDFNDKLDASRKIRLKDYIPALEVLRNEI